MNIIGQLHAVAALPPEEISTGTHWIRGWVDPRARLDSVKKRKILPLPGIEPRQSGPSLYRLRSPDSIQRRVVRWLVNWRRCGRKRSWINLSPYPCVSLEGLSIITKKLRITGLWTSIWTQDPPEYECCYPLDCDVRIQPHSGLYAMGVLDGLPYDIKINEETSGT
jgi:hypothetical protein